MKKLEFKTSKGSFILVDSIGRENYYEVLRSECLQVEQIGMVKNMTEEQFAEVVEWNEIHQFYPDYRIKEYSWYGDLTARESFESLVNSLGWYLLENPNGVSYSKMNDSEMDYRSFLSWHEAESKTLHNPILLKKI